MKFRPFPMLAHEVRATLAGTQTQVRRIVKPVGDGFINCGNHGPVHLEDLWPEVFPEMVKHCPFGTAGDRLWVRETWTKWRSEHGDKWAFCYAATHEGELVLDDGDGYTSVRRDGHTPRSPWRPSIHMPREASRLTLEIVSVRVERLNDISEKDAAAEGVSFGRITDPQTGEIDRDAVEAFEQLWESINGAGSWDLNPWVWALTFRRVGD